MNYTVLILPTAHPVEQLEEPSSAYLLWYRSSCWDGSRNMCDECFFECGPCQSVISYVTSKLDVKEPTFLTPDEFLSIFPELIL